MPVTPSYQEFCILNLCFDAILNFHIQNCIEKIFCPGIMFVGLKLMKIIFLDKMMLNPIACLDKRGDYLKGSMELIRPELLIMAASL